MELNLPVFGLYIFFSVILVLLFPKNHRWIALLITSLIFYYFLFDYKIWILIFLSLIIYQFGFLVRSNRLHIRWAVLLLVGTLFVSKLVTTGLHFDNFKSDNILDLNSFSWTSLIQVIGLSYFTFNGLSYLIDIKRKYLEPIPNYFLLLLYLVYFPAVFSGPLHRAKYLIEQFENIQVNDSSVSRGLRLILWGTFKSLVLSKRLFIIVKNLMAADIHGFYYLTVGFFFFLFLYCSFSAFVDFSQGVSELFNIKLKDNFRNRVYFSSSRQEFWKGWHITLNEWFRDYFFFIIAKKDKTRRYTDLILFITFLLIGLWHDLTIPFIIWGALSGIWIITEKKVDLQKLPFPNLRKYSGIVYHLFFASLMALVFISHDISQLVSTLFLKSNIPPIFFDKLFIHKLIIIAFAFIVMDYHYYKAKNKRFDHYLGEKPLFIRHSVYIQLIFMIFILGIQSDINNYYIQF